MGAQLNVRYSSINYLAKFLGLNKMLTKRQKQVLEEYSSDQWLTVFGCDFTVVMRLIDMDLLDFDHITGKVKRFTRTNGPYNYIIIIVSPLEVHRELMQINKMVELKHTVNTVVNTYALLNKIPKSKLYVEVAPI